jgi:hypothetical protein
VEQQKMTTTQIAVNEVVFVPTRDQLVEYIYETYKEIHNIKPRWVDFDAMSYEELDTWGRQLAVEADEAWEQTQIERKEARAAFEAAVLDVIAAGAGDRATALRWMAQAEGVVEGENNYFAVEHMMWGADVLFGEGAKELREEIMAAIG